MFKDRVHAGQLLAEKLQNYKNNPDLVVLAIPRGGVVPGFVVAKSLNAPLGIQLVKKLGHPSNREYAIGAVGMNKRIIDPGFNIDPDYIETETQRIRHKLQSQYTTFIGAMPEFSLNNKIVVIVDDGIATGNTLAMVLKLVKEEKPRKIIIAVPVAPPDALSYFSKKSDELICLITPQNFGAVGSYYSDFSEVNDDVVIELLQQSKKNGGNHSL